jgi:hypothetical protein
MTREEQLEAALLPFAEEADAWADWSDDEPLVEGFPEYYGKITVGALRRALAALATPATAQSGTLCDRVWFDGTGEWFTAEEVERHGTDGLREFVAVDSLPATAQGVDVASAVVWKQAAEICETCAAMYAQSGMHEAEKAMQIRAAAFRELPLTPPAPWQPPPEGERRETFQCLGWCDGEWLHIVWLPPVWRWVSEDGEVLHPTAFAPIPPAPEARDE